MDGFHLTFIAVGAGLYLRSMHQTPANSGILQAGWISLGAALCSAIVLLAAATPMRLRESATGEIIMSMPVVYEVLRQLFLGGAVIFLGLSFSKSSTKPHHLPPSEAAIRAQALSALTSPNPPDTTGGDTRA